MSAEIPLELGHVVERLHRDFAARLPAAQSGEADEKERNFLSRALAAFAIHRLSGCTLDEAATAIVDAGGDFGLDAIHYAAPSAILWIVQSKFDSSGRGEPALGEVSKFCDGIDALLRGNFAPFAGNAEITRRQPDLLHQLRTAGLQVRAILVYSGLAIVSQDRRHLFERLTRGFVPNNDYLSITPYNLTTVHDWVTGADEAPGVPKLELTIEMPGWVKEPYETIYGRIRLADLVAVWQSSRARLVAANLRAYKGSTDVNDGIRRTLEEEPAHFFYLNNGLTAYCERFEVDNLDRGNAERKRITVFGLSIVNGAQTLGSIGDFAANNAGAVPEGFVFLKIISLQACADDRAFATRITESTNFQNQITVRDFVALEEEQAALANGLILSGIHYHFKEVDDTPRSDATNFTLEDATTALAALDQQGDCDLLSRIVAQRRALWSLEEVYPAGSLHRSRYARLFKAGRSARCIWRAVQTRAAVLAALQRTETGVRKEFFENGRWLVMNLVFLCLHPQDGEAIVLTPQEIQNITAAAQEYAEKLWTACVNKGLVSLKTVGGTSVWESSRHFRSVFSSATDCQLLRNATLALINQSQAPPQQVQHAAQAQTVAASAPAPQSAAEPPTPSPPSTP